MESQALAPRAAEPFASLPRRSLAWILDVVIVTLLIFVAVSVLDAVVGPTVTIHPEAATLEEVVRADLGLVVLAAVLATGVSAAYFVVPWVLLGASPGQLALGMRVRDGAGGGTVPVGRALARWILLFPPFATVSALTAGESVIGVLVWSAAVAWYVVLLLTTATSASRQGLHDRIAATVVRRRAGAVDVR